MGSSTPRSQKLGNKCSTLEYCVLTAKVKSDIFSQNRDNIHLLIETCSAEILDYIESNFLRVTRHGVLVSRGRDTHGEKPSTRASELQSTCVLYRSSLKTDVTAFLFP